MEILVVQPALLPVVGFVLGLMIGSFLNVVIHRLPIMLERDWSAQCAELRGELPAAAEPYSLVSPRSRCPGCGSQLAAYDNIPVLSYLLLRGRCRSCKIPISPRYPAVELLTGLLFAFSAWRFGATPATVGAMLFAAALVALTFIDIDKQLLPDDITLPLVWSGLLFNLIGTFAGLPDAVIGAVAGYLSLWSVYWLFKLVTGKEGMGYGDFKLLAAIGAWLGWQVLPLVILLSSLVGAIIGIAMIVLAGRSRQVPMPFGPYLAIAGLVAFFWGHWLNQGYIGLF